MKEAGLANAIKFDLVARTMRLHRHLSDSASGIRFITLNLQSADQFAGGKAGVNSVAMTPAGGIGDDAYYLGSGSTEGLFVKKGQRAFKLAVYSTQPLEKKRAMEKALAQQVLAKL